VGKTGKSMKFAGWRCGKGLLAKHRDRTHKPKRNPQLEQTRVAAIVPVSHLPSKTWLTGQDSNLHVVNRSTWRLFPDRGPYVQNLIDNSQNPVSGPRGRKAEGAPELLPHC
jgi:hypothetical protein